YPYDVSKSCADLLAHTYANTYNLPVCITRCGNIFGPGDFNLSRIVPDTVKSALQDKTLSVRSNGKFTRDYIYVEDVVDGYLVLAEKMKKLDIVGEAFNFSNEHPLSVLDLVSTIYKLAKKGPDYKVLNIAKCEIEHQYLTAAKAKRVLGWKAKHTLRRGLQQTIAWYKEYLNGAV
ncbi:NAD-dependent epimerase/dehydratase family protein, partial [Candidatus Pacearchaeota archaeon]|nr:NAD-dependent epimerase/dehydratase family protein [Candidatus Pacearchaeota archaeon]